jgi:abortive infection bacteriophage resistance protein
MRALSGEGQTRTDFMVFEARAKFATIPQYKTQISKLKETSKRIFFVFVIVRDDW